MRGRVQQHDKGFTLIELILVMAVLLIAISIITPSISKFFDGRAVDSEANRFIALAHYGQARAVSEGLPMMLWIDTRMQTYGLKQTPGYTGKDDPKAVEYRVADGLKIDVSRVTPVAPVANSQTGRLLAATPTGNTQKFPAIYFSPEGAVIHATSVAGVSIQEANHTPVWIGPSANHVSYEIQDQNAILANARH